MGSSGSADSDHSRSTSSDAGWVRPGDSSSCASSARSADPGSGSAPPPAVISIGPSRRNRSSSTSVLPPPASGCVIHGAGRSAVRQRATAVRPGSAGMTGPADRLCSVGLALGSVPGRARPLLKVASGPSTGSTPG